MSKSCEGFKNVYFSLQSVKIVTGIVLLISISFTDQNFQKLFIQGNRGRDDSASSVYDAVDLMLFQRIDKLVFIISIVSVSLS